MEDNEIIERILKHGDTKCYAEVVKRYSGTIYSKVLRLVKQPDMAKDITQQAFIRAYSNLDTWRGGALGGWINAIAMHLALNHLSKMQRQRTDSIEDKPLPDMSDDYSEERENMLSAMDSPIPYPPLSML